MRSRCPTVRALRLGATTRKPVRAVPGLAAIIAVLAGLLAAAEPMPVACTPVGEADIIIVLGGAGPPRAARAAALHHAGIAPLVLVSGRGDCTEIRRLRGNAGVPLSSVIVECRSRNT